jgi:hypothetical protein
VQQHYQAQRLQSPPASSPQGRQAAPRPSSFPPQDERGSNRPPSTQHGATPTARGHPAQRGGGEVQRPAASPAPAPPGGPTAGHPKQPPPQAAAQHPQQAPKAQAQDRAPQGKGPPHEPKPGPEREHARGEQGGGERNK